jgi:N-acetylneuraminic acid mutarotase
VLYVYGGHTGQPHDHSAANLSNHFRRVPLNGGKAWEELPMQTPLQGVVLVAHGGRLYRIGGLNAHNATTDVEEDMHSTDDFASFDPQSKTWTPLAPLPAARSSHDGVVIGDTLYVVGGWKLQGAGRGEWQRELLAYDLAKPQPAEAAEKPAWAQLPAMPKSRRALAAGEWQGKLVAIGGIDEDGAVSRESTIFDPATGQWSESPELPAGDLAGFGASAWNLNGRLYVSGLPGVLYRLSEDGKSWEEAARLKTPRFFRRLLPGQEPNTLLAVAGSAEDGHVANVEAIRVGAGPGESPDRANEANEVD